MFKTYKNKKQIVEFCFYAFISVLPFKLIFAPIVFGLLTLMYLFLGDKNQIMQRLNNNKAALLLIFFYLLHVVGLFLSYEDGLNIGKIDAQLLLLLVPLVFVLLKLSLNQINTAKKIHILSCVIFCLFAMATLGYNFIVNYEHRLNYNFVQRSMYHFHYPYDVLYINVAYVLLLFNSYFKRYKLLFSILYFIV